MSSSANFLLYYCHLLEDLTVEVLLAVDFLEPEKHREEKAKVDTP